MTYELENMYLIPVCIYNSGSEMEFDILTPSVYRKQF